MENTDIENIDTDKLLRNAIKEGIEKLLSFILIISHG